MKKILISLLMIMLLTGCGKKYIKTISYDELQNKIQSKDTFVLYVGSSSCSHCKAYEPVLEKVLNKYKIEVFYIDVGVLSLSKYNAVMTKVDGDGTPTTVYIEKGKTKTSPKIEGFNEDGGYDTIVKFFKKIGYIGD